MLEIGWGGEYEAGIVLTDEWYLLCFRIALWSCFLIWWADGVRKAYPPKENLFKNVIYSNMIKKRTDCHIIFL